MIYEFRAVTKYVLKERKKEYSLMQQDREVSEINKNLTNKTSINFNNQNSHNLCTTIKNIFIHIFLGTYCIILCAICSQ